MTAQRLIYIAAGSPKELKLQKAKTQYCAVCGEPIEEAIPVEDILSDSFTNFDSFQGTEVCEACGHLLKGELATRLRRTSFVATEDGIVEFQNKDLSKFLFNPPHKPFVFCYTTSFKKHNAFRSRLNTDRDYFYVTWEGDYVFIDRQFALKVFGVLVRLYMQGFTKEELRTGEFPIHKLLAYPRAFYEYKFVSPHKKTLFLELLTNAIPSNLKELKPKKEGKKNAKRGGKKSGEVGLFNLEEH